MCKGVGLTRLLVFPFIIIHHHNGPQSNTQWFMVHNECKNLCDISTMGEYYNCFDHFFFAKKRSKEQLIEATLWVGKLPISASKGFLIM